MSNSAELDSLLAQFRERIRLFAARRLRNWSDAEDVAQESIRRAVEASNSGRLEKPEALLAFLFQTCVHICQHRGRSAARETRALRRVGASPMHASLDDPLEALISSERRTAVLLAVEKLNESDREILKLSYVEGLSGAEIGRRMGLSEGNVRVRRHRALQKLSESLGVTATPDRGLKE